VLSALPHFHPALARWFQDTFGEPTDVQQEAWASIRSGRHTLIAAPTGSGKTLAALLPCLDEAIRLKLAAGADGSPSAAGIGLQVLYITPLKALNNDIHHHVLGFAETIDQMAKDSGEAWPGLRAAVRTGDTTSSQRASMLRRPPEVLITTPESLFILLTSEKGRHMLRTVRKVIVDEIHDVAGDKRGAHLSLSLERLAALCAHPIQRIGVSATQKPMDRIARFLGGWEAADEPRPVVLVESSMSKAIELTVTLPDDSRILRGSDSVWLPILDRIVQLIEGSRSVIIFVNSRRLSERLTLRLNDHVGYEMARSHHGSVSRELRLEVERLLKSGELRVIVATSSLELGIDVGHVDLVLQLDSPLDAAAGIQRVGRAGHAVGDVSRGAILARTRGALPEIAVLSRLIRERDIEPIVLPENPLDVLSQHVVAMAADAEWTFESLHRLVCRSDSFHSFPPEALQAALQVLGGFYPFARPLVEYDALTGRISRRANSAMAALTGAGTIPSSSGYPVHHAESRVHLGELDEEFIEESRVGDVFQLGTSSWMIQSIRQDRIYVTEAANRFSEIPFWRNEAGGRTYALGQQLGRFWGELERRLDGGEQRIGLAALDADGDGGSAADAGGREVSSAPVDTIPFDQADELGLGHRLPTEASPRQRRSEDPESVRRSVVDALTAGWLTREYGLDGSAAAGLIDYVRSQLAVSDVPTDSKLVIEYYRDLTGRVHVVLHNHWGKRVNRTWLLAIQVQLERAASYRVYGNAKDGGIELVLPEWSPAWLQAVWQVTPDNLEAVLMEAIPGSPMLGIAFRRIAEISLLLSRSFTRTPMWQKRIRSEELLKAALPYAEQFPYLREAMRECLHDYLDMPHLREALQAMADGKLEVVIRETENPSPLAAQFAADYATMQIYEGDELAENVQLQLLAISKSLTGELFGADTVRRAIDPEVVENERRRLAAYGSGGSSESKMPQGPDDLFRLLKRRGDQSTEELLQLAGATVPEWLSHLGRDGRIASLPFGEDSRWVCRDELEMYADFPHTSAAIAYVAGRFAEHVLSFTEDELRSRYPALTGLQARAIVDELLLQERIEHAPFAASAEDRVWTSRRIASRIIRLSVQEARRQAEPLVPDRWLYQTAAMQHATAFTRLRGSEGLRQVIEKLQGIFLPLTLWESVILPSRLSDYRKEDLDLLCASGELLWIGRKEPSEKEGKIAFFLAESKALYAPLLAEAARSATSHPELLALLERSGASFLTKLARDAGGTPSELLAALLELVWEGRAANDQFAPLRIQADTKGKQLAKTGSGQGRWYALSSLAADMDLSGSPLPTADGSEVPPAMAWTKHLLDSCGILTKDLADAISPYSWDALLPMLKQLEQWGVVTRGLFVQDVQTMQFVKRELVPQLRQPQQQEPGGATTPTILCAADPANPFGLTLPWPKDVGTNYARKAGNYLVLHGGEWALWIEGAGKKVFVRGTPPAGSTGDDSLKAAVKLAFQTILRQCRISKIKVEQWNGIPAAEDADGAALVRAFGAERDRSAFVLWPSMLG
jgi:ATP-dependent helicase Lhr and Lhr-like helicase